MLEPNQAIMEPPKKFNLYSRNDPIQSFFGVKPLEASEANSIEKLLVDNFQPGTIPEQQVSFDIDQLKTITSEIKAINKQGVLLIGERIFKARELLKSYKDGTFVKWIDSTFESRRSAYNMLSYFELYQQLPNLAKEDLKKISQKAAYMLASRDGNIERKAELINEYHHLKADEMMLLIQEQFPSSRLSQTKDANTKLIQTISLALKTLSIRKNDLSDQHKQALSDLMGLMESIVL